MPKPTLKHKPPTSPNEADNLFFSRQRTHMELVNSGCELLNCVLGGGWPLGRIANIVGDKSTGKTLLAIEAMANFRRQYPEGQIAYCETEAAFDDTYAAALGLEMEGVHRPEVTTVEELFDDLTRCIDKSNKTDTPGLYIVDSLDALSDKAEQERGIEESTYGASKPKQLGQLFRRLVKPLEKSRVLVLIISQVRDAIGVTFGERHTRSGGRALDFYASQILWLANIGQNKKTVNKVQRTIGVTVRAKIKKNKIGQPFRECDFDILFGYGIDDVASHLDFLKAAGELARLDISGSDQSVSAFKRAFSEASGEDKQEMRSALDSAVREVWATVEASFMPKKGKYA